MDFCNVMLLLQNVWSFLVLVVDIFLGDYVVQWKKFVFIGVDCLMFWFFFYESYDCVVLFVFQRLSKMC